ncbi:hypothetical protein SY85_09975 [Flavisolibacter tropicus]|uniref:DUF502 domain-containing protein n=1 Tax=Flavisolibacter tropicus TaxID=1492898 RepID=A0A172U246_9BACT|nr:hypothetical protein SY85_09975 [Flavisolibacter tropicus]
MKKIYPIIRTTIAGGFLFLLPLVVLILIFRKASGLLQTLLHPLLKPIEDITFIGVALYNLIAVILLLAICFIAGLLAKTKPATNLINHLEVSILGLIPGYNVLKNQTHSIVGFEDQTLDVVLARVDDGWQLSFLIEKVHDDLYTVFIPNAPTPFSGSVYHLESDKIIKTTITKKQAIICIRQFGLGSALLLKNNKELMGGTSIE